MKTPRLSLLSVLLLTAGCGWRSLEVVPVPGRPAVEIPLQSYGEYPTSIHRVRVSVAATGAAIWEVRAVKSAQVWKLELQLGANPVKPNLFQGQVRVLVPEGSEIFHLQPGLRYRLEVWESKLGPRRAVFQL